MYCTVYTLQKDCLSFVIENPPQILWLPLEFRKSSSNFVLKYKIAYRRSNLYASIYWDKTNVKLAFIYLFLYTVVIFIIIYFISYYYSTSLTMSNHQQFNIMSNLRIASERAF